MKLPNAETAIVEREKIVDYLLNAAHRFGTTKARFFEGFGFRVEEWDILAQAILDHARENEVCQMRETGFGPRYQIDGELRTPDGRNPRIRTVWQFDVGQTAPRLITAHPLEAL